MPVLYARLAGSHDPEVHAAREELLGSLIGWGAAEYFVPALNTGCAPLDLRFTARDIEIDGGMAHPAAHNVDDLTVTMTMGRGKDGEREQCGDAIKCALLAATDTLLSDLGSSLNAGLVARAKIRKIQVDPRFPHMTGLSGVPGGAVTGSWGDRGESPVGQQISALSK